MVSQVTQDNTTIIYKDNSESDNNQLGVPMPEGWVTPPTLSDLIDNFNSSKSAHDINESKRKARLENLHIKGTAKLKRREGHSSVQPKVIRKYAEWRYSALTEAILSKRSLFDVKPRTHRDVLTAKQNKSLLNYQWENELNRVKFTDDLIRVFVDEGTVFTRTGWETKEVIKPKLEDIVEFYPAFEQSQLEELQQAAMLKETDAYAYEQHISSNIKNALAITEQQGQPVYPMVVGQQEVDSIEIVYNRPTIEVCNTANCYPDPSCNGDLDKAEFFIYAFETSRNKLSTSGNYFNLDKIKVVAPQQQANFTSNTDSSFYMQDKAREKFTAYEYWGYWDVHGNGQTTPIVATWVGNTLIRLEESPYPDGQIPFDSASYLPVVHSLFGDTDGDLLKEHQDIIGAVMRGSIDLMAKSANAQEGIAKGALDTVNLRRYQKGMPYQFNQVTGDWVRQHTYPEIPNSVPMMLTMQQNEAESLTGVKPYNGGLSGNALGDTATAVRGVLDAASKRESAILRRLSELLLRIAKRICAMNGMFLEDEEIIRVTDENFVAIRRDELNGKYDLIVDLASPESENAQAQELAFMLQTMGNSMPFDLTKIVLSEIASLRKMPNLAKRIEEFVQEPDPLQQQLQQIELEKAKLELAELQAKIQKEGSVAQLNMAKAQETLASAGLKDSQRDNEDLKYISEQSGRNHAQNIEQQQAQAQGNIALEIIKGEIANKLNTNTPKR